MESVLDQTGAITGYTVTAEFTDGDSAQPVLRDVGAGRTAEHSCISGDPSLPERRFA